MRAVVIASHGGVEGIGVEEVEAPPLPGAARVRVRVHAAGLNRADILQRRGKYPAPSGFPQNIPGLEFAGEVEAVGEEVRSWKIGDRVFGITAGGAQAEFVVIPESNLARIPAELNWTDAAAMPEVFITAHDALFTQRALEMSERVLIHAAGSGVGAGHRADADQPSMQGERFEIGRVQRLSARSFAHAPQRRKQKRSGDLRPPSCHWLGADSLGR